MAAPSHLERVRVMYDALAAGDPGPFLDLIDPDVRWHLPGASPYAGTTSSRDALVDRLLRQAEASGGTTSLTWVDGIADGPLVTVLERITSTRDDRTLDLGAVVVYRFADGRVVEAWDVFADQDAYDEFWR